MRFRALVFVPILVALSVPSGAGAAAVGGKADKSPEESARYWTDARMKDAKPREKARPGGGGGGATKPWAAFEPATYPAQHGKVFFTDGGSRYVCSGTAVTKGSASIVWTAGHCVWKDDGSGPVSDFIFIPAYKNGTEPEGRFGATGLYTSAGWKNNGEFGVDVGAVTVGSNAAGESLSQAVGGRAIVFGSSRVQSYQVIGYPAAGKFNGQTMRICNTAWLRDDTSTNPDALGVSCDMTGGSSGGGWLNGTGGLVSNVSYGYGSLKNVLFGPYLPTGGEAQSVYAAAG